ncbi:MAG: cupin domain-containing protein [Verrucomicrobiota bacterium]
MSDGKVVAADEVTRAEVPAGTGTSFQVLIGPEEAPHFAMRRFTMEPGGGMPRHTNEVEHEQYVLRGKARIGIGEETFEVKAGDVVFIPAGAPHWYEADGEEGFEFLCLVPNGPDEVRVLGED